MGNSCCSCRASNRDADPSTNLTSRDVQLIRQTWGKVARNKEQSKKNAVEMFILLFQTYPELKKEFQIFVDIQDEKDMRSNPVFAAHALTVFNTISLYVEHVQRVAFLTAIMEKTSRAHILRRLNIANFEKFANVLPSFMTLTIGVRFTPEADIAWRKLFAFHNKISKLTVREMGRVLQYKRSNENQS